MSAESVVNAIIEAATALADDSADRAQGFSADGITAAGSVTDLGPIPTVAQPTRIIPEPPPANDEAEDRFRTTFNELYNQLTPDFAAQFETFKDRFFPKIDECLQESVDGWLCSTIENGGSALPASVEDQIWEKSRARELTDFYRQDDELVSGWAGRGFSLPTGALFAAQQRLQQDFSGKISTHSRDVAIKQFDAYREDVKFAVGKSIELRMGALQALAQFMQTWLQVSKLAVDYANGILHARQSLYGALASYYNSLIAMERLIYDWGKDRAALTIDQQRAFVSLVNANTTARVGAAVSAAQAMGRIAEAALSSQNTMGQLSHNTETAG